MADLAGGHRVEQEPSVQRGRVETAGGAQQRLVLTPRPANALRDQTPLSRFNIIRLFCECPILAGQVLEMRRQIHEGFRRKGGAGERTPVPPAL